MREIHGDEYYEISKLFLSASPAMLFHSFLELLLPVWWSPTFTHPLKFKKAVGNHGFSGLLLAVLGCDDQLMV